MLLGSKKWRLAFAAAADDDVVVEALEQAADAAPSAVADADT